MSWMDAGDIRKKRGGKVKGNQSAKDAKHIARTDPDYKSVDKAARKAEKKRGDNVKKRREY